MKLSEQLSMSTRETSTGSPNATATPAVQPQSLMRDAFIHEVVTFKRENGVKLHQLFVDTDDARSLRSRFLENSAIKNYLTRAPNINQSLTGAPSCDAPGNPSCKLHSDYYELRLYRLLGSHLPFRRYDPVAFRSAAAPTDLVAMTALQTTAFEGSGIWVMLPTRKSCVRDLVDRCEFSALLDSSPKATSLQVIPRYHEGHVTTWATIFDPLDNNKALVSVFIDSGMESKSTGAAFAVTFNSSSNTRALRLGDVKAQSIREHLRKAHGANLEEKNALFVEQETNTAYVVNGGLRKPGGLESANFRYIYRVNPQMVTLQTSHALIPVVNASHGLQTDPNDFDCTLYAYNFTAALGAMCKDTQTMSLLMTLARRASTHDGRYFNRPALRQVRHLFLHELSLYLPAYYRRGGQARSAGEIGRYHIFQRWTLGSKALTFYIERGCKPYLRGWSNEEPEDSDFAVRRAAG